jgi:crotonobetainyl-CoA:carnitine CoA-transferase CaiB-like acyl-CoA transferase
MTEATNMTDRPASAPGGNAPVDARPLPLQDVRVLDLSRVLAGPLVAQMLGDLGAEVIKVEKPGEGDDSRAYGPPFLDDAEGKRTRESGFYLSANRNKRSITVDLSKPEGQDIVRRLAQKSDVVIENFRVGTLAKFGLDYATLSQLNPRVVYLSITGYGQTGRMAHKPGYDAIFQAAGGHMAVSGAPDHLPGGGPTRSGLSIVDILTSQYGAIAILAALNHRDHSHDGAGQYIDLALLDSMVATLSHRGVQYLISGKNSPRRGNVGGGGSPSQAFRCSDGQIVLTVGNDLQWRRFCSAIGEPALAQDPRFLKATSRIENRELLTPMLEAKFASNTKSHWLGVLDLADIPSGPVNELDEVFADSQVRERGMVVPVPHPVSPSLSLIANPIRFSKTPLTRYNAPPMVGEHTEAVMREVLGMDDARIEALRRAKVI